MKTIYSNVTTSLPTQLVEYINQKASAEMSSKSDIVRRALLKMREDDLWNELLEAEKDIKEGKTFSGDLKKLARKIKD